MPLVHDIPLSQGGSNAGVVFALPLALTVALGLIRLPHATLGSCTAPSVEPARRAPSASPPRQAIDSSRYDSLIRRYARQYGVDPALVKAVMHAESGFQPAALSPRGARGLMQIMPETARFYGVEDLFDPRQNVRAGVRHLRSLLDKLGQDIVLAVAAYNAGSAVVERYGGVPPFRETQLYVNRVMFYRGWYHWQMPVQLASGSAHASIAPSPRADRS
jgi:soluble lytic murein transglycosylase-like protein